MNETVLTREEIQGYLDPKAPRKTWRWRPARTARMMFYVGCLVFFLNELVNGTW